MRLALSDILDLERTSARAWPAERQDRLGDWSLNASSGFSGRINACWPLGDPGLPFPEAVRAVEAWYAAAALPSLFKVVDAHAVTTGVAEGLARAGYRPRTETLMMLAAMTPLTGPADAEILVGDAVDPRFAAVFAATAPDPGDARERLGTLARIPYPRAFARLDRDGKAAAIGACAVEDHWVGIFAMRTGPDHRRQGFAWRVLTALLRRAASDGARRAWLQVEADNPGAIALYERAGFVEAYRYRYWVRPR